jgi:hypothetical protein
VACPFLFHPYLWLCLLYQFIQDYYAPMFVAALTRLVYAESPLNEANSLDTSIANTSVRYRSLRSLPEKASYRWTVIILPWVNSWTSAPDVPLSTVYPCAGLMSHLRCCTDSRWPWVGSYTTSKHLQKLTVTRVLPFHCHDANCIVLDEK